MLKEHKTNFLSYTERNVKKFLRVITVDGVKPGAGDSNRGDDSLDAGPSSSSPTVVKNTFIIKSNEEDTRIG